MAEWTVVLKNVSGVEKTVADLGLVIAIAENLDGHLQFEYGELASSDDLRTLVTAGDIVVNDGTSDLSAADGVDWLRRASKKYVDDQITNLDISGQLTPIQDNIDALEAAIGTDGNGDYVVPVGSNYLDASTSVMNSLSLLDTAIGGNDTDIATNASDISTLQTDLATEITNRTNADTDINTEITTTQAGAGLNADGSYTADGTTNYITGATSLKNADFLLDAQIKIVADDLAALGSGSITDLQTEVDAIETGAGLETDGTYAANDTTNYIKTADFTGAGKTASLKSADELLDAQVKTNADNIATNTTNIGTNTSDIATNASAISTNATNITANANAISTETTNRTNADTALQNAIDAVEVGAGLDTDGGYTPDGTADYISGATSLKNADSLLDDQIKVNTDAIAAETSARTAADALKVNKAGDTMTGNLDMGANKVLSSAVPATGNDLTNKTYVDSIASGFSPKADVDAATTANITLSGLQTIDTVVLAGGERVLVKDQTDPIQNGCYVAAAGAWVRSVDFDGTPANECATGSRFYVSGGEQAGSAWTLLGPVATNLVPDTDAMNFGKTGGTEATSALQTEVDAIETSMGLNNDGTYIAHSGSNYMDGAGTAKAAREALDTQVKANADNIATNTTNIATNAGDISSIDTRVTALETGDLADMSVINGVVYGKDTTRTKWLGPRETFSFARKGNTRNQFLEMTSGVPSNLSGYRVERAMTITSIAVQLDAIGTATFQIRKNDDPTVIGSITVSAAAGAQLDNLDVDLAAGEYIQLFCSNATAVDTPVCRVVAAYNGGAV